MSEKNARKPNIISPFCKKSATYGFCILWAWYLKMRKNIGSRFFCTIIFNFLRCSCNFRLVPTSIQTAILWNNVIVTASISDIIFYTMNAINFVITLRETTTNSNTINRASCLSQYSISASIYSQTTDFCLSFSLTIKWGLEESILIECYLH